MECLVTDWTVRGSQSSKEKTNVGIELCDGAHRGARISVDGLLINAQRRG